MWIGLDRLSTSPNWFWADGTSYTENTADFVSHDQFTDGNNKCMALYMTVPTNANFAKFDDYNCDHNKIGLCQIPS